MTAKVWPLVLLLIAVRHDVADEHYRALGEQYPAVVRVGENGGNGTLVGREWVATAGHVASGLYRRHELGFAILIDGQAEPYHVRQIIVHPRFEDMGPNDLALIRLDRPVTDMEPVALYRARQEVGKEIILVGHGDTKTGTGGEWKPDRKKRGATNIVDSVTEAHIVFDFDAPPDATRLEGTAGPGDSGGPAFIIEGGQSRLAGISSLGQPGKNGPGTYGAIERYVRVSSHVDWIDEVMRNPPPQPVTNVTARDNAGGGPGGRVVRGGPGRMPEGTAHLEEVGLIVALRDGAVRMIGRIDQLFPQALLDGGIRPPAAVKSLNGTSVESVEQLASLFKAIPAGESFELVFEHNGKHHPFRLVK